MQRYLSYLIGTHMDISGKTLWSGQLRNFMKVQDEARALDCIYGHIFQLMTAVSTSLFRDILKYSLGIKERRGLNYLGLESKRK
jgi:hypothetical protein